MSEDTGAALARLRELARQQAGVCADASRQLAEVTSKCDALQHAVQDACEANLSAFQRAEQAERERDKWLEAFNRSEQFQSGPTQRAEHAEAQLAALRAALEQLHAYGQDESNSARIGHDQMRYQFYQGWTVALNRVSALLPAPPQEP